MSTYRDISTLPLDALRSVTYDHTGERQRFLASNRDSVRDSYLGASLPSKSDMPSNRPDSILATNEKLYEENRKLRRCLSLFAENSKLKTVNVLSTVMSICDDQLRNFITEQLVRVDSPKKATTRANTTQTFNQQTTDRTSSPSYGKSFARLGYSDLRNSTLHTPSYLSNKLTSTRKNHSPTTSTSSHRPPMKFGYGPSPYARSPPPKFPTDHSFSDKSPNSTEKWYRSSRRSQSRNMSKNKYSVKFDTKERHQINSTETTKGIVPARPTSAPSSLRKFDTQEFVDTKVYGERDSSAFSAIKSVRHCRKCGINLLPNCKCPVGVFGIGGSYETNKTPIYLNDKPQVTDTKQGTSAESKYETARCSIFNSISTNRDSLYNPSSQSSDISEGTILKRHVSKSINFTRAPHDRLNGTQPNDDCVIEKNRQEKYVSSADRKTGEHSTQTTSIEVDIVDDNRTADENLTSDDLEGTSVDIGFEDLQCSACPQKRCEAGTQNRTPSQKSQEETYKRIGIPLATSTPLSSPPNGITASQRASNLTTDILADIMGVTGRGSKEKVNFVLHRPLDALIGYTPDISDEASLSLAVTKPNKRVVGEIAFQLDRRILEFVFAKTNDKYCSKRRSRYYGYSVASIMLLIKKEVKHAGNDPEVDRSLRMRLELILENLHRFGYKLERHSEFTQDMVNKYGLLNGAPDPNTVEGFGLNEPAVLRILLGQILKDEQELDDMLIILDCLHYMTYKDGRSLFLW